VWQHLGPGQVLVQREGFPKYPWAHMISGFPYMGRKMTWALPCLGMDALSAGLCEIHWDGFEIAYAYDIDESLIPTLLRMHGAGRQKGCFGFSIEVVLGITHRARERSYYETWYQELRQATPMFRFDSWSTSSSRNIDPACTLWASSANYWGTQGSRILCHVPAREHFFADCLHKGLRPADEGMLTPHQRNNLSATQPVLQARLMQRAPQLNTLTSGALAFCKLPSHVCLWTGTSRAGLAHQ
jgi:hypothetical protein